MSTLGQLRGQSPTHAYVAVVIDNPAKNDPVTQ
jgi:hypothetical protein